VYEADASSRNYLRITGNEKEEAMTLTIIAGLAGAIVLGWLLIDASREYRRSLQEKK
jgi:hypothetical protein